MFGRWIRGKGGLPPSAYSFRSLLLFGKKNQPAAVGRIRRRPRPICAVMGIQSKEKPKEKKEKKSRNGNANRFWRHRQEGGRKTGPWIIFRRLHAKHLRLPLRLLHLIAITRGGGEEQPKVAVASTQFRFDNFSRGSADYQVAFIYWILLSLSLRLPLPDDERWMRGEGEIMVLETGEHHHQQQTRTNICRSSHSLFAVRQSLSYHKYDTTRKKRWWREVAGLARPAAASPLSFNGL